MKTFYKINTDKTASIGSGTVVPQGFTEYTKGSEPQKLLDALFLMDKPIKLQELQASYTKATELDIKYLKTTFQADSSSQDTITKVLTASGGTLPTGFAWLDVNNNQVQMTYAQLQGLANAILLRNQQLFIKYQSLKTKVASAKTQADLDLIKWV